MFLQNIFTKHNQNILTEIEGKGLIENTYLENLFCHK